MRYLLIKKGKKYYIKEISLLKPSEMKALTNEKGLKIVKLLSKKPMYPVEIARKLDMYPQKVYYYVKKLERVGVLKVVEEKEIKGGTARLYGLRAHAFGMEIDGEEKEIRLSEIMERKVYDFLGPLIKGNEMDGLIGVGSPLPHGPFNTGARDGHYSAQLALFLGRFLEHHNFCVRLDVDVKAENLLRNNLILIGGPGVNIISHEINKRLPYFFNIASS